MKPDTTWRTLTVIVAIAATAATVTASGLSETTATPLPREGSSPVAAAHHDDMSAYERATAAAEPVRTPATPAEPDRGGSARSPGRTGGPAEPSPSGDAGRSTVLSEPRGDARLDDDVDKAPRAPAQVRAPATLQVPDLGVESPVVRTSMDASSSIIVPEDVLLTGWFDGSQRLGARHGSTVIVGHRDSASQGSGALYAIEELPIGSRITVVGLDGTDYDFTVDSVEFVDKATLPREAPRIFTRSGPYRLVLITCGGDFDASAGSYLSNVIITAAPSSDAGDNR